MIAALLALALTPPPSEPRWQSVGSENGVETAYDPASVQPADGKVRVRIRGVGTAPDGEGIRTVAGLIEVDCVARTRTSLEVRGFDANGGLVFAALVPMAERVAEPIRSGSPTDAVARRICESGGQ